MECYKTLQNSLTKIVILQQSINFVWDFYISSAGNVQVFCFHSPTIDAVHTSLQFVFTGTS